MAKAKMKARTIADFKAAHDPDVIIPGKFRAAFAAMAKIGPDHYLYEEEFRKFASLGQKQVVDYRGQFADHIVETTPTHGKSVQRVYFSSPKAAEKARIS